LACVASADPRCFTTAWLTQSRDLSRAPSSSTAKLSLQREVREALMALAPPTTEQRWASEEQKKRERLRQRGVLRP
jgi:hypothetical protein